MGDLYRPSRLSPLGGISAENSVDDIISRNVLQKLKKDPPPRHDLKHGGKPEEIDLVTSMAKRLAVLEKEMKEKTAFMKRVQAENDALKSKLKVAEEEIQRRVASAPTPGASGSEESSGVAHLKSENARLRAQVRHAWRQVEEIKMFLNDYGLVWVGVAEPEGLSENPKPVPPSVPGLKGESSSLGLSVAVQSDISAGSSSSPTGGTEGAAVLPPRPPMLNRATSGGGPRRRISSASSAVPISAPASALKEGTDPGHSPSTSAQTPTFSDRSPPVIHTLPISLEKLHAAVEELNQMAGDGIGKLVGGGRGAAGPSALHTPEPIRLVLYQDGLQVHRSAPKSYSDPASVAVLKDVMDGYFPITLKAEFPDGVPIKVVDRTYDTIASTASSQSAAAAARAGSNVHSFHDLEEADAAPMSGDKFLSKLPQTVIKNGKVINIRSEVGKLVGSSHPHSSRGCTSPSHQSASVPQHVSTPTDALLTTSQRNHLGPSIPPPSREAPAAAAAAAAASSLAASSAAGKAEVQRGRSGQEIATLQVKSEDGQQTFILKMQFDDSIYALRKCIDAHRTKLAKEQNKPVPSSHYEIRGAFPARAYTEAKETLRDAGLVPNATLFLKAL
ncbi:hypothetical protein CEUSTIGMA_g13524.t1 [Chlamydomonas eustigma]|uniref:UBX domain-containing protein n=1 Tax=Chlamydomonas eustigma TaxID=1157962 RepID=A0A250XT64_9CHLO|nr:hypothetical protein CEUSTIGMA_g13524.t1 [Chlamydomonas eustigma]|eukprot:GAX86112.1 hypothetical protein CEUSTIGMA_g13524.t1 [Chlamydomonas eustigma]